MEEKTFIYFLSKQCFCAMACPKTNLWQRNSSSINSVSPASSKLSLLSTAETILLPESLRCAAWLMGKWTSTSKNVGMFPGMHPFEFAEELNFSCSNQPTICYSNKSYSTDRTRLMHQESGFLRVSPVASAGSSNNVHCCSCKQKTRQHVALTLAHGFGVVEILEGEIEPNRLVVETTKIESTSLTHTPPIIKTKRVYVFDKSTTTLTYELYMATFQVPQLTQHIYASYRQITDEFRE